MAKSNLYTRTGDLGTTSLVGGTRVEKNSARLEAYGTIDEANSWLGLLNTSEALPNGSHEILFKAMNHLFDIGAALATEPESKWQPEPFPIVAVEELEHEIDRLDSTLPRHHRFILPSGHPDSARANIARTVVRRAERRITSLLPTQTIDPTILRYVNRLSDYLFILGRAINYFSGKDEIFWEKTC